YRLWDKLIPQIIWAADANGLANYLNSRWSQYTGLDASRGLGHGWLAALHPDDHPRFEEARIKALGLRQAFQIDLRLRRVDGVYRWHLLQVIASSDRSGGTIRWLGTFTDIDSQKWAEGALAFLAESGELLASTLDDRTALSALAKRLVPAFAALSPVGPYGRTPRLPPPRRCRRRRTDSVHAGLLSRGGGPAPGGPCMALGLRGVGRSQPARRGPRQSRGFRALVVFRGIGCHVVRLRPTRVAGSH